MVASGYFEKKGNQTVFCMKGFALDTGSGLSLCENPEAGAILGSRRYFLFPLTIVLYVSMLSLSLCPTVSAHPDLSSGFLCPTLYPREADTSDYHAESFCCLDSRWVWIIGGRS